MRKKHAWPLFVWTIFLILFFLPILLGWQRFPTSDFSEQFHAFATFQSREMLRGHLPLWSPHSYGGVPFVADPQTAVFYPLRWLTIFASAPWNFPLYALQLEAILHIWLAGAFTYMLAYDMTRSRLAGLLAAVTFGLGGYLVSYPLLQLAILESITWLPLILLCIRRGVNQDASKSPAPWFVGAGLVLALSATAGHPQTLLHVAYSAVAYYLFLVWQARWSWKSLLGLGSVIACTGLMAATAYWLPLLRFQTLTTRANVDYGFVSVGQPLLHYLQVLVPATLSLWSPEYWGVAGFVLVAVAWLARRDTQNTQKETAELTFWGGFIIIMAWVALGDSGILFQLVYYIAPGFSLFRQQERLLGPVSLASALMAAQGLALWLRLQPAQRQRYMQRVAIITATFFAFILVTFIATRSRPQPEWPGIFLRQLLISVLVLAWLWRKWRPRLQVVLLIVLLVGDLFVSLDSSMNRYDAPPTAYWQQPDWLTPILSAAQQDSLLRVDTRNVFWANVGEAYGWQDISGISPLKPQALAKMERVPRQRRWQLLNVGYVVDTEPLPDGILTPVGEFSSGVIEDRPVAGVLYQVDEPYPRAWMVYDSVVVADEVAALTLLSDPEFNPQEQVILGVESDVSAPTSTPNPAQVHVTSPRAGWLNIDVETTAAGYLVISEWYYPGWQVWVDGEPAQLQQANVTLQAVALTAGTHSVALRFQPIEVPISITISLLALLGSLILAWRWRPVVETAVSRRPILIPKLPAFRWQPVGLVKSQLYLPLMTGITFVAYALRLFRLDQQELRGDEGFSYGVAVKSWLRIITLQRDLGEPHSPLHYLLLRAWMLLTGDSEFAMRYSSLIPGLLIMPLAYLVGRRLVHARFGLLLAALLTISQSLIWLSQDIRNQYTLALMFSLMATLVFLAALRRWRWWLLYVPLAALTVYAHTYGLFALLAHGAYILAHPVYRRQGWRWALSGVGAALLFLPWLSYSLPTMVSVGGHFSTPSMPNLAKHLVICGVELSVGSGMALASGRWLFLALFFLTIVGGHHLWREKRHVAIFLLAWLGSAVLGMYYVRYSREIFNPFYVAVAAPAWWALVGMGLWALWAKRSDDSRWLAVAGGGVVVLIAMVSLTNYFFDPDYYRDLGYRKLAGVLETAVKPSDVIVPNYPDPSITYYVRHLDTPIEMQPATYQNADGRAEVNLETLAQTYDRLWFLPVLGSTWDPNNVAFRWLDYHTLLESEQTYGSLTLSAYRPVPNGAAQVMVPLDEAVNGQMVLAGAYLTEGGQPHPLRLAEPISLQPGAELEMSLLWQVLAEMDASYTVFVHVLDENGRLLAQHDGIPAFGTRPTSTWQVGEQILDKHRLTIPAEFAGAAGQIVVGLYNSETIERQAFANGQDYVWLGDMTVDVR